MYLLFSTIIIGIILKSKLIQKTLNIVYILVQIIYYVTI